MYIPRDEVLILPWEQADIDEQQAEYEAEKTEYLFQLARDRKLESMWGEKERKQVNG